MFAISMWARTSVWVGGAGSNVRVTSIQSNIKWLRMCKFLLKNVYYLNDNLVMIIYNWGRKHDGQCPEIKNNLPVIQSFFACENECPIKYVNFGRNIILNPYLLERTESGIRGASSAAAAAAVWCEAESCPHHSSRTVRLWNGRWASVATISEFIWSPLNDQSRGSWNTVGIGPRLESC